MSVRTFLHRSGAATVATALVATPMTASAAPHKSHHVANRVGTRTKAAAGTKRSTRDELLSGGVHGESVSYPGSTGGAQREAVSYPGSTVDAQPIVRVARGNVMIEVPVGQKVTDVVTLGGKK